MLVVVVNEFLQGGWLAFLRTLKLEQGASAAAGDSSSESRLSMHAKDRGAVERTTASAKVTMS